MKHLSSRAALAALAATILVGCTASPGQDPAPTSGPAEPGVGLSASEPPRGPYSIASTDEDERGSIIESTPLDGLDPLIAQHAADAQRVTYRSTSGIDGTGTTVTAAILTPAGTPPEGGWPVLAYGHGTTGVAAQCGPSQYPGLLGQGNRIAAYLDAGYAVAATDYEGLDGNAAPDGPDHPYLEPVTAAYNMIDAVRAARASNEDVSDKWASIGVSQGGQAAWSALEAAPHYGDGLQFIGGVAIAPAADLTPITDGPRPWTLGPFQLGLLPYVLDGYRVADPGLDFDDYLRGSLADGFGALEGCTSTTGFASALTILSSTPDEVGPFTDEAAADIRDWLEDNALPLDPTSEPLLVLYGDSDTVIPPAWTEEAVQRACAEGMTVDARLIEGADHFSIGQTDVMIDWLDERFAGQPANSTC